MIYIDSKIKLKIYYLFFIGIQTLIHGASPKIQKGVKRIWNNQISEI